MKSSYFALPVLLRTAVFSATASHHVFSVHDDLLAMPQFEVRFTNEYLTEPQAQSRIERQAPRRQSSGQIDAYSPVASEQSVQDDYGEDVEYKRMNLEGQGYLCSIPQVAKSDEQELAANETESRADHKLELTRAANRGWELLSGMEGNCVYFISGWWSYKFCYNQGLRQFHQLPPSKGVPVYPPVEDPSVEGFTLGMYRKETDNEEQKAKAEVSNGELVQRGENRYLVQKLEGGTKCDLTGRERRTEVQFHCNPQAADRISLIKEVSTCAYLMVIQTPRLCNDVAFLPPQKDEPNHIICSPILADSQINDYERDLEAMRNTEKEAEIWQANADAARVFLGKDYQPDSQVVGDIIVGAHAIVPKDLKLEKSVILGGGKVVYVDTVASSDGTTISKEDLESLGIKDSKALEQLTKKLTEYAGGADWKLQVIDTPRGREYRAILVNGDDDGGGGEGQDGKQVEQKKSNKPQTHQQQEQPLQQKQQNKQQKQQKQNPDQGREQENEGSQEEYYRDEL